MRFLSVSVWALAILVTVSNSALAADSEKPLTTTSTTAPNAGFYVGPKFFLMKDQPYAGLFAQSGFDVPSKNRVGLDFGFYAVAPTGWRFGFDFSFFGLNESTGSPDATFQQFYFGALFGKNLISNSPWELFLGSSFGLGSALVEVLSPTVNGRLTESSFYIEPSLLVAHPISNNVKLGFQFSYVYPMNISSEAKGQSLGMGHISAQGWTGTLQFILGTWGKCQGACGTWD